MVRRLRAWVDAVLERTRFERDLRDELRLHLDQRTDDLIASGLDRDTAARQARVEFGAVERYKEQCRDERGFAAFRPWHGLGGDIRLAARRLAATPQFLLFAALSLAVGLAVTTAVYSILYSIVWRPLAFADPSRVVFVSAPASRGPIMRALLSAQDYQDLRDAQTTMAAIAPVRPFTQTLIEPAKTELIAGEAVGGNFFRATGVAVFPGRAITPEDETAAAAVVVLSDRMWRTRFDADPEVIGRTVRLGGQPFQIVGVAAPRFDGIEGLLTRVGVWIPLSRADSFSATGGAVTGGPDWTRLTVLGRLAEGRTVAQAASDVAGIGRRLDESRPRRAADASRSGGTNSVSRRTWSARSADDDGMGADSRAAALVVMIVALVLGVACTNLANLMLARGSLRQHEFAVRRALGASRWRLVRELFVEGGLVALAGGLAAMAVLSGLLRLATIDMPLPRGIFSVEPELNLPALLMAGLALGLSMLVFGLEPALQLTRRDVTADFTGGPAAVGAARSRRQQAFIRWQVAVSATFFLVAAVLVNLVMFDVRHDTGVDVDRLGMATVHFGMQGWDEPRARRALQRTADELRGQRGIESVAFSTGAPFGVNMTPATSITTPDRPFVAGAHYESPYTLIASPEIFRTLGVPIVGGRAFDARDDAAAARVAVVSEFTARRMFGTADAIGRQLLLRIWRHSPDMPVTIVGIARDTDTGDATGRGDCVVYVPLAQHFEPNVAIFARTSGDPWDAVHAIQLAVRRADPDLGIGTAAPAWLVMSGKFFAARLAASFASTLGLITLLMSMVGLYGIQSHLVARRTREVGVRMAIGASAAQIKKQILGEGCRPVLQGLALGSLLSVFVRLLLRATVDGHIDAFDPLAFAVVPVPLIGAALLACYLPARRAARVDPNEALRHL